MFVLSHLPHLVYFDYQKVPPPDVVAAKEAHQVRWCFVSCD
jgi:hypothetical protein